MATITTEEAAATAMAGATVTVVEVAALVVLVEVDVKSLALPNFYFLTDFNMFLNQLC